MYRLLAILGMLLVAATAYAAPNTTHGQKCDSDTTTILKGKYRTITCINLCNNYASADDNALCTEYSFATGLPDIIILELEDISGNCTSDVNFTFTTGPVTGGAPEYSLDPTAVVLNSTTERLVLLMDKGPLSNFLFTNVTNDISCTDVDVRMYLITEF